MNTDDFTKETGAKLGESPLVKNVFEWLHTLFGLVLVALIVMSTRASLADHYVVPSGSMRPTIVEGDHIVVDKLAFGFRLPFTDYWLHSGKGPARGDVVVLRSPEDGTTLVKRVMGLPGETIAVQRGAVMINGQPIEEQTTDVPGWLDYGPVTLNESEYLVLGDNRARSHDGRVFGPVRKSDIFGKVEGVVWRRGGFTWVRL